MAPLLPDYVERHRIMQQKNIKRPRRTARTSRRKRGCILRHLIAIPLAGVLSFFIGLILLDQIVMPWVVRKGQKVEVPDVTSCPKDQAQKMLSRRGFQLVVDEKRSHPTLPEGYVISQDPRAHTITKKGHRVYVVLSTGKAQYEMIDVSGVSVREATLRLQQAGFEVGPVVEEPSRLPKGVVIAQDPKPGERVGKGTLVRLLVSTGEKNITVLVPDLVNLPIDEARSALERVGLLLGKITRTPRADVLPNTVIEQSPRAGEELVEGQQVDLIVSATLKE